MEKENLTEEARLKSIVKKALKEFTEEQKSEQGVKLYNVNQIARRLGKAHATIKKLIAKGLIKTTKDGLISEQALNEYLNR
jgi:ribosomal protein S20